MNGCKLNVSNKIKKTQKISLSTIDPELTCNAGVLVQGDFALIQNIIKGRPSAAGIILCVGAE